jgi:hypothetical protein
VARQPLLASFREVLVRPDPPSPRREVAPEIAAVMLTHAVASRLAVERGDDPEDTIGGVRATLASIIRAIAA